jgi:hypothetical protein
MHFYVLHSSCHDVICSDARILFTEGCASGAVGVESLIQAKALSARGAVAPLDFISLANLFTATPSCAPSLSQPRRLRFDFKKAFHVSPFFPMNHIYSWVFSEPGDTLLVQSQNSSPEGSALFHTQLRLVQQPSLTWLRVAHLLLVAFPLLTYRIQWLIHVEAFRLWFKGAQLFDHPDGATNTFTRVVASLFFPVAALFGLLGKIFTLFAPLFGWRHSSVTGNCPARSHADSNTGKDFFLQQKRGRDQSILKPIGKT